LVQLTLTEEAGVVQQGRNHHVDWWVSAVFDPCAASTIVAVY